MNKPIFNRQYLLICVQEANFQTRTILVPWELFYEERKKEFYEIKASMYPNTKYNIVYMNYIRDRQFLIADKKDSKIHDFANMCTHYSADSPDDMYFDSKDKQWVDESITNLCHGFNHIDNYLSLLKVKKFIGDDEIINIEIIDHLLILETFNNKLRQSKYNTPEEMMKDIYGCDIVPKGQFRNELSF